MLKALDISEATTRVSPKSKALLKMIRNHQQITSGARLTKAILAVGKKVTILKVAEKLMVDKTFKIVQ